MAIQPRKRQKESPNGPPAGGSGSTCIIAPGTTLEGNLFSKESIRMDGSLTGDLSSQGKLVLGARGRIQGNVDVAAAVIQGKVTGNVIVKGLLHITEGGKVVGEIQAAELQIERGAVLDGTSRMGAGK